MSKEFVNVWKNEELKKEVYNKIGEVKVGNIGGYFIAVVPTPFKGNSIEIGNIEGEKRIILKLEYKDCIFANTYPYDESIKMLFIVAVDKQN